MGPCVELLRPLDNLFPGQRPHCIHPGGGSLLPPPLPPPCPPHPPKKHTHTHTPAAAQKERSFTEAGQNHAANPVLHRILTALDKVIVVQPDVIVLENLLDLWAEFDQFKPSAVMALAVEQRVLPWYFLCGNKNTAGFNSGVQLLHLARMRSSSLYNKLVDRVASHGSDIHQTLHPGRCSAAATGGELQHHTPDAAQIGERTPPACRDAFPLCVHCGPL